MSVLSWFFKSKKIMSKENTKNVKIGKYIVTAHAQNKIADSNRNLKKSDMPINLLGKSKETKEHEYQGELQYSKINFKRKTITHITPKHKVKTIYKINNPKREFERRNEK